MNRYAILQDGVVREPIVEAARPPEFHVDLGLEIFDVTAQPQVAEAWSLAGEAWSPPTPTAVNNPPASHRESAWAKGVALTSDSAPALDGTYACDRAAQQAISAEALYIQLTGGGAGGKVRNGMTSKAWLDQAGEPHIFSAAQFLSFAEGVTAYVDAVIAWAAAGPSGAPPANVVAIA